MTAPTNKRRLRWPWIVVVLAVVVVIAVIVGVRFAQSPPTPGPTATQTRTPTRTTQPDAEPTGCLGGNGRDASMLFAAQKAAPHSEVGAVEVAAALVRWTFRYPQFSTEEANEVSQRVISTSATPQFRDLAGSAAKNPNNSGGVVADGTPFYLSMANGVWHIESASADKVVVSIGAVYVVSGAVSSQLRSSTTVEMVWQDGGWRAQSGSITRTTEELFRIGTPFTEGC